MEGESVQSVLMGPGKGYWLSWIPGFHVPYSVFPVPPGSMLLWSNVKNLQKRPRREPPKHKPET